MGRLMKFLFGTFSFVIALIAIGIGYLKFDHVNRQKCKLNHDCKTYSLPIF